MTLTEALRLQDDRAEKACGCTFSHDGRQVLRPCPHCIAVMIDSAHLYGKAHS